KPKPPAPRVGPGTEASEVATRSAWEASVATTTGAEEIRAESSPAKINANPGPAKPTTMTSGTTSTDADPEPAEPTTASEGAPRIATTPDQPNEVASINTNVDADPGPAGATSGELAIEATIEAIGESNEESRGDVVGPSEQRVGPGTSESTIVEA